MSRYLLTISYNGKNYCGWQVQPNGNSVQSEICKALKNFLGKKTNATGCSRTDSGVHAKEFCLHFDCEKDLQDVNVQKALNFYLPDDIRALSCEKVAEDFHARYSCIGKRYVYRIFGGEVFSPFEQGFSYHEKQKLDIDLMKEASKHFVDRYDFSAFCSSASNVEDKVRTITECNISTNGEIIEIRVSANGFLYNMVRIIVGTLIDVGKGKIKPSDIENIINSKNRELAGKTVPPEGLFLEKVFYEV